MKLSCNYLKVCFPKKLVINTAVNEQNKKRLTDW